MAKGNHRTIFGLKCVVCKNVNYITERNKINTTEKMTPTKYCKHCRKRTEHREVEKLK